MFGIIGIIVIIAVAGTIAVRYHLSVKERKAVQLAQEYLDQKYEQEMQFESVRYSWVDPGLYHVYFISTDTEIRFEVQMWPKALDFPEVTTDDRYIWDNYLSRFFCRKTEELVSPEVKMIWDENAKILVVLSSSNVYPSRRTSDPNEQMTASEMEPLYNYDFYIETNRLLNNESKIEEANRMFDMIEYVKKTQYRPREVLFWYQTGAIEKGKEIEKKIWFGDGNDPYHIGRFENWFEINNVEEVVKAIDEQWFNNK